MVSVSTEAYSPVQGYMFLVYIKAQMKWNVGQGPKKFFFFHFQLNIQSFGSIKIQTLARVQD